MNIHFKEKESRARRTTVSCSPFPLLISKIARVRQDCEVLSIGRQFSARQYLRYRIARKWHPTMDSGTKSACSTHLGAAGTVSHILQFSGLHFSRKCGVIYLGQMVSGCLLINASLLQTSCRFIAPFVFALSLFLPNYVCRANLKLELMQELGGMERSIWYTSYRLLGSSIWMLLNVTLHLRGKETRPLVYFFPS